MKWNGTRLPLIVLLLSLFLLTPHNQTNINHDTVADANSSNPYSRELESDVVLGRVDYTVTNTPESFNGYNLFVLMERDRALNNISNLLLITDMDGNVVAEKQLGAAPNYDCTAEFINPNTILLGTDQGAALWNIENDTMQYLGFSGHHEYEYNPNSNTVFTLDKDNQNIDGVNYAFDTIMEYDLNGTLVWWWNVSDFISKDWWCPHHEYVNGIYRDISHGNSVFYDADEDIIYFNARNPNTFFKLNHTSKEVIWGLGEYGNFTMYDLQGVKRNDLFYHAHSVEAIDDSTFILFDNDLHNQTNEANKISRILEVKIDESSMTANESWYYEAPRIYFSAGWGDADRLPNGDRLGVWGYPSTPAGGPCASLIEVNPNHEITWRLDVNYNSAYVYGIYRMERFRNNPVISSLDDIVSVNKTYSLTWDVRYDFRNKWALPGNYTLFVDGVPKQNGLFSYAKFWQPSSLPIDTGSLSIGAHNLTLEIDDGYGNKASDTVIITVETFHISRLGPTVIEKGQTESLPTWSGFTETELSGNITVNGTLYSAFNWTGQDIVLDPAAIDVGTHLIHFQLFNGTESIYNDIFWLQVNPTEAPLIVHLQPTEIFIYWTEPLVLSWNLSDTTPHSWSILLNGIEVSSGTWNEMRYTLNWSVPVLPIGTHNITVSASDLLGQRTASETNISVYAPSFPMILSAPENETIRWGVQGIVFKWTTYNAETWNFFRNGTQLYSDDATSGSITVGITNWRIENWRPGLYNLTMVVWKSTSFAFHTFWLDIVADPGDPYADAVLPDMSDSYLQGENALGAPDGEFATIYEGYMNGYLTLDMGMNEEIIDGIGSDFAIHARGGNYSVSVANSVNDVYIYCGAGRGNGSYDLSTSGISEARFVRIVYSMGADIELDAIEAIHFNTPPSDTTPPNLVASGDPHNLEYGLNATITWLASDETPWSYEIYVNATLVSSDYWNGSNIVYVFDPVSTGLWNVTLVVHDAFGNAASDSVMIDVYESSILPPGYSAVLVAVISVGALSVVLIILIVKKKVIHKT